MEKGWPAAGRLTAIYARAGGRDALAEKAGVSVSTLSNVNSGSRMLGRQAAERIIAAVDGVTLADLGAPAAVLDGDPSSLSLLDRLAAVEAEVAEILRVRDAFLEGVLERLDSLEAEFRSLNQRVRRRSSGDAG